MKTLYEAKVTATGGREGKIVSADGKLQLALALPKALGGPGGDATNPEQLFAAGYAACFESAIRHVARARKIEIQQLSVTARIGLGASASGKGFALSADLEISAPGMDRGIAQSLIEQAHEICPYSNATRGNIPVGLRLVE